MSRYRISDKAYQQATIETPLCVVLVVGVTLGVALGLFTSVPERLATVLALAVAAVAGASTRAMLTNLLESDDQ